MTTIPRVRVCCRTIEGELHKPYCPERGFKTAEAREADMVNHPPHYENTVPGIEPIQVTQHFSFCLGNVIKYVWRAGSKEGNTALQDLKKARWYLDNEIRLREAKGEV